MIWNNKSYAFNNEKFPRITRLHWLLAHLIAFVVCLAIAGALGYGIGWLAIPMILTKLGVTNLTWPIWAGVAAASLLTAQIIVRGLGVLYRRLFLSLAYGLVPLAAAGVNGLSVVATCVAAFYLGPMVWGPVPVEILILLGMRAIPAMWEVYLAVDKAKRLTRARYTTLGESITVILAVQAKSQAITLLLALAWPLQVPELIALTIWREGFALKRMYTSLPIHFSKQELNREKTKQNKINRRNDTKAAKNLPSMVAFLASATLTVAAFSGYPAVLLNIAYALLFAAPLSSVYALNMRERPLEVTLGLAGTAGAVWLTFGTSMFLLSPLAGLVAYWVAREVVDDIRLVLSAIHWVGRSIDQTVRHSSTVVMQSLVSANALATKTPAGKIRYEIHKIGDSNGTKAASKQRQIQAKQSLATMVVLSFAKIFGNGKSSHSSGVNQARKLL